MRRRHLLQGLTLAPWLVPAVLRAGESAEGVIAAAFGAQPAPAAIRRIFAAGPPAGVLVYALAPERLLGWPLQLGPDARALLAPATRQLPYLGRLAGRGSTVSVESLLQHQPDLILDTGDANPTYVSGLQRVAQQTGIPCILIRGRLTEHPAQLLEVGARLGVGARAQSLAAWAQNTLALAAQVRDATPLHRRPRVYYGRGPDGLETGLDGSINMEVLELCGGRNVAAAAGPGGLTKVSMEQLLAWNPEVIVTQDPQIVQRALQDPAWRSLSAVVHHRVHCAPSLPFGWLDGPPSVNRLIGVHWLLARLYPDQGPSMASLREQTLAFYRLFYGTELNAAVLDALLRGAA